jgi:hypothetical protein
VFSPFPYYYVPEGMAKPACCPYTGGAKAFPGNGPDVASGGPGGGTCYGPNGYKPDDGTRWALTRAGWWLGLNGHLPQHLARMQPHPRVLSWRTVQGAQPEHEWRVPVMLTNIDENGEAFLVSALDRVWTGSDWRVPDEIGALQSSVSSIATGVLLADSEEERNRRFIDTAIGLLSLGHWVDADFLAAAGWLSEKMMLRVVEAAFREPAELAGV